MTYTISDLYVVAYFDYFGEPSCGDLVYTSKDEAKKKVDELHQRCPNLKHTVMDLQDFIWECTSYYRPN